jgi:hypothetical protein
MKLAILFPGIGYHTDKPLLYYSKKILKNMNYEIKEIHFENQIVQVLHSQHCLR